MKYLDLQLYNVPRPDADQVRLQHKMALYFKDDLPEGISNKQGQPFVGLPGVKDSGARVLEVDFQSGHKRYLTKWGTTSEELQQLHAEHSARCSRGYQDREDKELLEKYSECFEELLAAKEQLVKAKVGKSVAYQNVLVADDKLKDHLKKNLDESHKPDLGRARLPADWQAFRPAYHRFPGTPARQWAGSVRLTERTAPRARCVVRHGQHGQRQHGQRLSCLP
eukprot:SAG31_NODE_3550_length_4134_cov_2.853532_1_plen_223_part_00